MHTNKTAIDGLLDIIQRCFLIITLITVREALLQQMTALESAIEMVSPLLLERKRRKQRTRHIKCLMHGRPEFSSCQMP